MIAVIVTRAIPEHLRGYLGRFLSEVVPGVFVGKTSRVVAERLWGRVTDALLVGSMAMILTDPKMEQGYSFRTAGATAPTVVDLDGLQLIANLYNRDMGVVSDEGSRITTPPP